MGGGGTLARSRQGVPHPGPDGGSPARSRSRSRGGVPQDKVPLGYRWGIPIRTWDGVPLQLGMGYPPSGPREGYPPSGPGMRYPLPPPQPEMGYPPRLGQQKEYSLRGGRYASCVHAGGLFLFEVFNKLTVRPSSL